ncbi:MAG: 50S ribosomal protein L20 [Opitutaceae bacterium]
MPRSTNSPASRRRRKRVLEQASGYFGNKSRLFRYANDAVNHALQYAYRDRRNKKRTWRALWITRLNAACRENGITYSRFIEGLEYSNIGLDRKALADIAVRDPAGFTTIVGKIRTSLDAKSASHKEGDDLGRIEGVGPKIRQILADAGINAYAKLAETSPERIKELLVAAGPRFNAADPTTWPEQAALAAKGDWRSFNKLTAELQGGRRV